MVDLRTTGDVAVTRLSLLLRYCQCHCSRRRVLKRAHFRLDDRSLLNDLSDNLVVLVGTKLALELALGSSVENSLSSMPYDCQLLQ